MTPEDFNKLLRERVDKIFLTLDSKGVEYATDADRLHNFKVAAQIDGETPAQALWGMFKKHLVSLKDMKDGVTPLSKELIDEKCGDTVNYVILLEAIFIECLD